MAERTDSELAERAKEQANTESTAMFDPVSLLCPACNEPCFGEDPNPNDFVIDPEQGEYGNNYAAFQIHPARIIERDPENPWDRICVVPREVEYDEEENQLQVRYYRHDFSSESYQAWQDALEEEKQVEQRKRENQSIDGYMGGDS